MSALKAHCLQVGNKERNINVLVVFRGHEGQNDQSRKSEGKHVKKGDA